VNLSEDIMTYQEQQEAIKNKVVGVVNDAADRAGDLADKASRQGTDIANRASKALNDAGVDTDSLGNAISSAFDTLAKSVRTTVRDRPLGAIAVTAAIGLILGAMSSR
jgi:ElaB/YqjD/DUF883 family membrane-anchored ribosome-binding protein